MAYLVYPTGLPWPTAGTVIAATRNLVSDLPGLRGDRNIQRDYLGTQTLEWLLLPAQSEVFEAWWRVDLIYGGAWFEADWPMPNGALAIRRFVGNPVWTYIGGANWNIKATVEIRGRGTLNLGVPSGSPA